MLRGASCIFPPKVAQLNSSALQDFTTAQHLRGKLPKVKREAGAWFPLTTSTVLLHVLLNISLDWLLRCLKSKRFSWHLWQPTFPQGHEELFQQTPLDFNFLTHKNVNPGLPKASQRHTHLSADLVEMMISGKPMEAVPSQSQAAAGSLAPNKRNTKCKSGAVNEQINHAGQSSVRFHAQKHQFGR